MSSFDVPLDEYRILPQYGFGSDVKFSTLVAHNRFLFRVYSPHSRHKQDELFFVGKRFDKKVNRSPQSLHSCQSPDSLSYEDAVEHMDLRYRSNSPFISTSFSFAWAIWEALSRYRENEKHNVEIAVIDATTLLDRSVTALELLQKAEPNEAQEDHWKWYRFAQESQSVLVYGCIPNDSIFASVPLRAIVSNLPSYFLHYAREPALNPMDSIAWPVTKSSFRHFCQTMSDRYLRLPVELRLRDSTVGAVQLSASLLGPWFGAMIARDDVRWSVRKVSELAWVIACWADTRGGVLELGDVIEGIVSQLAEEVRERKVHEVEHRVQLSRLQWAVDELEKVVGEYEHKIADHRCEDVLCYSNPLETIPELETDTESMSPTNTAVHSLPPSPQLSKDKVLTSEFFDEDDDSSSSDNSLAPIPSTEPSHILSNMEMTPGVSLGSFSHYHETVNESRTPLSRPSLLLDMSTIHEEFTLVDSTPSSPCGSEASCEFVAGHLREGCACNCIPTLHSAITSEEEQVQFTTQENISCVVTGFFVGAFIALCVMSGQRRTLLTNLT